MCNVVLVDLYNRHFSQFGEDVQVKRANPAPVSARMLQVPLVLVKGVPRELFETPGMPIRLLPHKTTLFDRISISLHLLTGPIRYSTTKLSGWPLSQIWWFEESNRVNLRFLAAHPITPKICNSVC